LLALAVAVPTACVLWFMGQAVRNTRLAVRQKLIDVYEPRLHAAADAVSNRWNDKAGRLEQTAAEAPPAERFAALVSSRACDAAVIYDEAGGVAYPAPAAVLPAITPRPPGVWAEAQSLVTAGDAAKAADLLGGLFSDPGQAEVRDSAGRLVAPPAGLRALELIPDSADARRLALREALIARLNDYGPPAMPPAQRRFLMHRLRETEGEALAFPTLAAEDLAADYLARIPTPPAAPELTASGLPGVWRLASADGRVVGLFCEEGLLDEMQLLARETGAMPGASIVLRRPGAPDGGEAFLTASPGDRLPGWRLALMLEGGDPFSEAAGRETAGYLWAGLLSIGAVVLLALVGGRSLLRQAKLTRLKNDFVATVTHELKTPLACIRMFAETLREGRFENEAQARRYLDLLVSENERLARLIDNFLTFSRMERNKRAFEMAELHPEEVVHEAANVVAERFSASGCRFDVNVPPALPAVSGDHDALVTVLLNLLDNACKYTGRDKRIALSAETADGAVCFRVSDNGIGMSRREARRAFERFFQADSHLARRAEGCGLGLSIVKFIVDAHGGTIDVESTPGEGSTFTVRVPIARETEA